MRLPQAGQVVLLGEDPFRVELYRCAKDDDGYVVTLGLVPMEAETLTGWLDVVDDPNDQRTVRWFHRPLRWLARLTGRIYFFYYDEDHRMRLYFGRADRGPAA